MRNNKKVAVTGGAGFIGSHLAELLASRGYRVVILDDLSSGKMANIETLLGKGSAEFIQGSVVDLPLLKSVFQGTCCVFHLAALPGVPLSIDNPKAYHEVNVTGTLNVLLAARDCGVSKVVYASSSSVYGDSPVLPQKEDVLPGPQSPYATTKLAGEYYCRVFRRVYGLPAVCLRYFNVYGPRQDSESEYAAVIPRFISQISQGSPPVIYGDGEQTRDFTFARDAAEANILAAESGATGIFNIGGGKGISINRLAKLIAELMGSNLALVYEAPRPGDIRHSLADISRAKAFGYEPGYSLEAGLRETIGWHLTGSKP